MKYFKLTIITICLLVLYNQSYSQDRDNWQEPERVMDVIGVKPGMTIGEPGAGEGYFTFKLAKRVGKKGKIYANDIKSTVLEEINEKCKELKIKNVKTILGEINDPLFPKATMDMVIMVYVIHDMENPVEFLKNLQPSMKPGAKLILLEQEPEKTGTDHFFTKEKLLDVITKGGFKVERIETFLLKDTLYILSINKDKT